MGEFEKHAVKIFKALGDSTRYTIVCLLFEKGEMTCGDFDQEFDISKPAMSHHFRILENANLIKTRKRGQHVIVSINEPVFSEFLPQFETIHLRKGELSVEDK